MWVYIYKTNKKGEWQELPSLCNCTFRQLKGQAEFEKKKFGIKTKIIWFYNKKEIYSNE